MRDLIVFSRGFRALNASCRSLGTCQPWQAWTHGTVEMVWNQWKKSSPWMTSCHRDCDKRRPPHFVPLPDSLPDPLPDLVHFRKLEFLQMRTTGKPLSMACFVFCSVLIPSHPASRALTIGDTLFQFLKWSMKPCCPLSPTALRRSGAQNGDVLGDGFLTLSRFLNPRLLTLGV